MQAAAAAGVALLPLVQPGDRAAAVQRAVRPVEQQVQMVLAAAAAAALNNQLQHITEVTTADLVL